MLVRIDIGTSSSTAKARRTRFRQVAQPPNALTLVRLPLAAAIWLRPGDTLWLFGIVAVAALTDTVDGRLARWWRRRNPRYGADDEAVGAWLDPLCDKVFAVSALMAVWLTYRPPFAIVVLTLTRELLLVPLLVAYHAFPALRGQRRFDFHADSMGKATTAVQFAVVVCVLVAPPVAYPVAIVASAMGALAVAHYFHRELTARREVMAG